MNNLISRKDAIEHLKKRLWETALNNEGEAAEVFAEIADDRLDTWMAEIRPAQQWIPVTERLPEKCQTVIASVDTHIYEEARFVDGRWWWAYEARTDYWEEIEKDVTAWMPLPEPYRKGANPP